MGKKSLIIVCFAFGLLHPVTNAQKLFGKELFLSPGLSIGYTFGAKINFGMVLDFGLMEDDPCHSRYGLAFSYYLVRVNENYKSRFHRHRSINLMFQNDVLDLKLGYGRMRNGWGYENRNRCIVQGFSGDISLTWPSVYSPCIGYKIFLYPKPAWAWFEKYYHTVYTGYEYNVFSKRD